MSDLQSRQQLDGYPGIESDYFGTEWGTDEAWDDEFAEWWQNEYGYEFETGAAVDGGFDTFEGGRNALLADQLKGYAFVSPEGEEPGEVEDIMMNLKSSRISYIALSSSDFLGLSEKMIAVPIERIQLDSEEENLRVGFTEEELESVQGFVAGSWPAESESALFQK